MSDETPVTVTDQPVENPVENPDSTETETPQEEVTDTVEEPNYTEEDPHVTESGDKVWNQDGHTYRESPDGSRYVSEGVEEAALVRVLSDLYPDRF